jgi:hypothetical protein
MKPPWIAHPELKFRSTGWRMGYGEDYLTRFSDWYATLTPQERDQYERDYPEPESWPDRYSRKRASLDR